MSNILLLSFFSDIHLHKRPEQNAFPGQPIFRTYGLHGGDQISQYAGTGKLTVRQYQVSQYTLALFHWS